MPTHAIIPVFDGHNDTLMAVGAGKGDSPKRSFFERSAEGHLDYSRAREGGLAGGIFAIFVETPPGQGPQMSSLKAPDTKAMDFPLAPAIDHTWAQDQTLRAVGRLITLEKESAGRLRIGTDVAALEDCLAQGVLSAVIHCEGAEAIDSNLESLEAFYRLGLRSLGIVWSRPNAFAEGVPFRFPHSPDTGPGLTDAGRALVRACNGLGIALDVSHLNEKGFWDVAALTEAPLIASHSNAHALCPVTRNLTDRQLDAIGESGGVVGLNFAVGFLRPDAQNNPDTPVERLAEHARYIADRIGVDHLALGSDFDGATIPQAIGDASGLQKVLETLAATGFDELELIKIAHQNWFRVLRDTWK